MDRTFRLPSSSVESYPIAMPPFRLGQVQLRLHCTAALMRTKCCKESVKFGMARRRSLSGRTMAAMRCRLRMARIDVSAPCEVNHARAGTSTMPLPRSVWSWPFQRDVMGRESITILVLWRRVFHRRSIICGSRIEIYSFVSGFPISIAYNAGTC